MRRSLAWLRNAVFDNWRIAGLIIAVSLVYIDGARAEPLKLELLSTSIAPAALQGEPKLFDEIIVFGSREKHKLPEQRALDEALLERVLRDLELQQEVQKELEWREASADLDERPIRVRFGYDLREQAREPTHREQRLLPMDLVMPATVLSVDF